MTTWSELSQDAVSSVPSGRVAAAKTSTSGTADGRISNSYVEALVGPSAWDNSRAITYHLAYSDTDHNGIDDWDQHGAGDAFRLALQLWASVADLRFVEVSSPSQANLVEYIDDADGNLGWHDYPGWGYGSASAEGHFNFYGDGWDAAGLAQGGYGFVTIVHELGHALGLEHPHDGDLFPGVDGPYDYGARALNQGIFTTMSYNDGWRARLPPGDDYGWQGGPMALDIAAIQSIYGANTTFASGDDTYLLPDVNGPGAYFLAIWDTGGVDQIAYAGNRDTVIDLGPATISKSASGGGRISAADGVHGGYTIAKGVVIENASGGAGDDTIVGNGVRNILNGNGGSDVVAAGVGNDWLLGGDGRDFLYGGAGADELWGEGGNDVLVGGTGGDLLVGGLGRDVFDFNSILDSRRAGRDLISDFVQGEDIVDLRTIDANEDRRGNQKFKFLGESGPTKKGHQVYYTYDADNDLTIVRGDVDGNRKPDFQILLSGQHVLTAGDFVL